MANKKRANTRVYISIPGRGNQAHEYEHCPILQHGSNDVCPLGGGICRFGLTEISPPEGCPMGKLGGEVTMKFNIVKR